MRSLSYSAIQAPPDDDETGLPRIVSDRRQFVETVIAFIPVAAVLSLTPILVPLGDPYNVTVVGYFDNAGYFLWYTGVGWCFLWVVHVAWYLQFRRVMEQIAVLHKGIMWPREEEQNGNIYAGLNGRPLVLTLAKVILRLSCRKSAWVPTLFPVLLFFASYVVIGGPFPFGTLVLGVPCFVFSWWCISHFEKSAVRSLPGYEGASVHEVIHRGLVRSLIPFFALMVANLLGYFSIQCIMSLYPRWNDYLVIAFSKVPDIMRQIDVYGSMNQIADQLKPEPPAANKEESQEECQAFREGNQHELQDLLERKHQELRTLSLLFRTFYYYGLHVTYLSFLFPVCGSLRSVIIGAVIKIAKSLIDDMTPMLDDAMIDLLDKLHWKMENTREGFWHYADDISERLADKMFIQLSRYFLDLMVPVTFAAVLAFNKYSWNKGLFFVLDDLKADDFRVVFRNLLINLFAATVAGSMYVFTLKCGISRRRLLGKAGKMEETAESKVLHSALNRLQAHISAVCYHPSRASGIFFVLVFTQAAITTVVGICMLMKHDGMDVKGVMGWAFQKATFPWRLHFLWEREGLSA